MLDRILRGISVPVFVDPREIQPDRPPRFEWHDVRFTRPPESMRVIVQVVLRDGVELREALYDGGGWVLQNSARLDNRSTNYWTFIPQMPPR